VKNGHKMIIANTNKFIEIILFFERVLNSLSR